MKVKFDFGTPPVPEISSPSQAVAFLEKELHYALRLVDDDFAHDIAKGIGVDLIYNAEAAIVEVAEAYNSIINANEKLISVLKNGRFISLVKDESVLTWCEENFSGKWEHHAYFDDSWIVIVYDHADQTHFKLRWTE